MIGGSIDQLPCPIRIVNLNNRVVGIFYMPFRTIGFRQMAERSRSVENDLAGDLLSPATPSESQNYIAAVKEYDRVASVRSRTVSAILSLSAEMRQTRSPACH
jgi:hypothetical protein